MLKEQLKRAEVREGGQRKMEEKEVQTTIKLTPKPSNVLTSFSEEAEKPP